MQSVTQRHNRTPQWMTSSSRAQRSSRAQGSSRGAFSLIELMIVITIIAILMSLLLVGVRGAMTTARTATVTVEFKNIEKGIADFRAKYGTEPPSSIVLFETPAGWTGSSPSAAAVNRSRALIRQMWPDFDFSITRDINGDNDALDTITLNGAECLVFFLGGLNSTNVVNQNGVLIGTTNAPITSWGPLGFSANPTNPFTRGGARSGPFHEFSVSRITNRDGSTDAEGMPEYVDPLPGQRSPILYASSYGGKGYRDVDVQFTTPLITYNAYVTPPTGFAFVYRRYTGTYPATVPNFIAAPAFNPKSFQLISPGFDGEYGWGGTLSVDMELIEPRAERYFERDNITNFKGGTIN